MKISIGCRVIHRQRPEIDGQVLKIVGAAARQTAGERNAVVVTIRTASGEELSFPAGELRFAGGWSSRARG